MVAANPEEDAALAQIEAQTGRGIQILPARRPEQIAAAIRRYYPEDAEEAKTPLGLFEHLVGRALQVHCSDIHVDPQEEEGCVRMRVDGLLRVDQTLSPELTAEVVSAIKVAAGLDIAEHRVPQDGQINLERFGETVNLRIATMPTIHGEKVTARLLANASTAAELATLEGLDMSPLHHGFFTEALRNTHGILLLSGPTGSGKTTTLYAALRRLREPGNLHIVGIEDPVEIPLAGINQMRIDSDRVSFGGALRSALRHDPDIIMLGEIRDEETADIAVKCALTGHLVLSTVHTNDSVGVVTRLLNLGVTRDLLASTLRLAVAQRLVRRPCPHCLEWEEASPAAHAAFGWPEGEPVRVPRPRGCSLCAGTGYAGRCGLFEMFPVDRALRALVLDGASEAEMRDLLFGARALPRLLQDGAEKIRAGHTTVAEVERVTFLSE